MIGQNDAKIVYSYTEAFPCGQPLDLNLLPRSGLSNSLTMKAKSRAEYTPTMNNCVSLLSFADFHERKIYMLFYGLQLPLG